MEVLLIVVLIISIILIARKEKKRKEESLIKENMEIENRKIEELKSGLPVVNIPSLLLGNDKIRYYEPAILLVTKNKVVGRTGGGSGMSVKIAKGVSVRTGSGSSKPIYGDVTTQYLGKLIVTDERAIFTESQKGFDIKIKDISIINPYEDGVIIQSKSRSYPLLMDTPRYFIELLNAVTNQ